MFQFGIGVMRKTAVVVVLTIFMLSYMPNNELNNNSNFTEDNIQFFSQNQGINEYDPIMVTSSGIEIDVNFTASQRQVWFKVYSLGPNTWINNTIQSSVSENVNLIFRAHNSFGQCALQSINLYSWNNLYSNFKICSNPTDDPTILLVFYLSGDYFLHGNGSINYDKTIQMRINLTTAEHQSSIAQPPIPQPPASNPYADGMGDYDSDNSQPLNWNFNEIYRQMNIDVGTLSSVVGSETLTGYFQSENDTYDKVLIPQSRGFNVNYTYPNNQNYTIVPSQNCQVGNLPNDESYIDCSQIVTQSHLSINLNQSFINGYLYNPNSGENYSLSDIRNGNVYQWREYSNTDNTGNVVYFYYNTWYGYQIYTNGNGNGSGNWYIYTYPNEGYSLPLEWQISVEIEQLVPIEDYLINDIPGISSNYVLYNINSGITFTDSQIQSGNAYPWLPYSCNSVFYEYECPAYINMDYGVVIDRSGLNDGWNGWRLTFAYNNPPTYVSPQDREFIGMINNINDIDTYSGIIEHGFDVDIEIETEKALRIQINNVDLVDDMPQCNFNGISTASNEFMTEAGKSHTISCDSEYFADIIQFSIGANQSYDYGYSFNDSQYTFTISKGSAKSIPTSPDVSNVNGDSPPNLPPSVIIFDSIYDNYYSPPPLYSVPTIELGYNNGTFLHASDTLDVYNIVVRDNPLTVYFNSTCATMGGDIDNTVNQFEIYSNQSISVSRIESLLGLPVDLLNRCDYSILVLETEFVQLNDYQLSSDMLSVTNSVTIPAFDPETAPYGVPLSVALLPTLDGKIIVTQESGKDVLIFDDASNQRAINELTFGQSISVGQAVIQVSTIYLQQLDGSQVQVSLQSQSLNAITKENNEINGNGYGSLGVSGDEGFDYSDQWEVDISDGASYYSVKMVSKSPGLDASINNQMSFSQCVTNSQPEYNTFNVGTYGSLNQSGDYQISLSKYYGSCPYLQINARSVVSPDSNILLDLYNYQQNDLPDNLRYYLYDEYYGLISTSELVVSQEQRVILNIPNTATASHYYLLLANSDGVIFDEKRINVDHTPSLSVDHANFAQSDTLFDLGNEADLIVVGLDSNTGNRVNWNLSNLTWYGYENEYSEVIIETLDDVIEGTGTELISIDYPDDISIGDRFRLEGLIQSEGINNSFTLNFVKPYFTANLDCDDSYLIDYSAPQNDILCTVTAKYGNSLSNQLTFDDINLEGSLELYSSNMFLLENYSFSTDNNGIKHIRIPVTNYQIYQDYYAKLFFSEENKQLNGANSVEKISVGLSDFVENNQQPITDFEFTMIPLRVTALPGDTVEINWQASGQNISSVIWEISDGNKVYSTADQSFEVGGLQFGSFEVTLPEKGDMDLNFILEATAYSIYGESVNDALTLIGADSADQVYLEIEPRKPILGESFSVDFEIPSAEEWIAWSYELNAIYTSSPSLYSLINSNEGFIDENSDSIKIDLPFNEYLEGSIFITIDFEIKDGSTFSITEYITTQSYREIKVDSQDVAVLNKDYSVDWSIEGEYLNSADSVESIRFSLINFVDGSIEFEQIIIQDGFSGEFTIGIPGHLETGTHRLVIEFEFIDGSSESYVRLLNVDPQPKGINFLGINIPSVPYGYDTIIAVFLLVNVVILHRKLRNKDYESKKSDIEYDSQDYEYQEVESEEQELYDYVVNDLSRNYNNQEDNYLSVGIMSPPLDQVGYVDEDGYEWIDFNGKKWYRFNGVKGPWTEWT